MHNPDDQPTPAQLERARKMNLTVPEGANSRQVSSLLNAGPPSQEQLGLAKSLEVKVPDGMNSGDLSRELTKANVRLGTAALRNNPALRAGKFINVGGDVFEVTDVWPSPRRPAVTIRPAGGGKKKVVSASSLRNATEVPRPDTRRRS